MADQRPPDQRPPDQRPPDQRPPDQRPPEQRPRPTPPPPTSQRHKSRHSANPQAHQLQRDRERESLRARELERQRQREREREEEREREHERQRQRIRELRTKKSKSKIYTVGLILVAISLAQLIVLKVLDVDLQKYVPVPGFVWMMVALICMTIMICTDLFSVYPINWLLAILIVEVVTFGVAVGRWTLVTMEVAFMVVGITLFITILLHLLGAFCPLYMLPGTIAMFILIAAFIIVFLALQALMYFSHDQSYRIYIDVTLVVWIVSVTVYSATIIHERRAESITDDFLMSAMFITVFYMILLSALISIAHFLLMDEPDTRKFKYLV
ncbi:uncharacterized protein LOC115623870 [Scaptodrosophila lebanonensis]|uniref:Uncharacterized protein LOC115623870 n=1 Tax=Drosophila lebanonensis TaxID=7225 RepID=A0A6J2TFR6_DROLE|nr:uncharacterized protein LOC115623870 [Scaptodrosophila lebanonensis]